MHTQFGQHYTSVFLFIMCVLEVYRTMQEQYILELSLLFHAILELHNLEHNHGISYIGSPT